MSWWKVEERVYTRTVKVFNGARYKRERLLRKLSCNEAARRAMVSGVFLMEVERGTRNPSRTTGRRLLAVLAEEPVDPKFKEQFEAAESRGIQK